MTIVPYKVYVVVDREFGERLAALERDVPVLDRGQSGK